MRETLAGMAGLLALAVSAALAAEGPGLPPVEGLDRLGSWTAGVKAADAAADPLVLVCFGDSNTELPTYTAALRESLQGCYGERGSGYHTFGSRIAVPDAPLITKKGTWTDRRVGPELPPVPWFAPDLLWTVTEDPAASVNVSFVAGKAPPADNLARGRDTRHRFRVHYQTGPGLGSFGIFLGDGEAARIDCAADKPGYGVSEGILADGFRIGGIRGKVVLFGTDTARESYRQGAPVLKGGARVHALGRSWGQAAHFSRIEQETFDKLLGALKPDLVTILLGTNDMHNEGLPDRFRDNLAALVRKIRQAAPGVGILVIACPEAPQTKPGFAARYRDLARAVAQENGCAFWPLTDVVGERSRAWNREGLFADDLHYNRIGGSLWARLLLRELKFDVNDLAHYPVLRAEPAAPVAVVQPAPRTLPKVAKTADLAALEPLVIWRQDRPAAELRLGAAGSGLAVYARVFGANDDASIELYVSKNETNAPVRQLVLRRASVSLHENGQDRPAPALQPAVAPLEPFGFELSVQVPLEVLGLTDGAREFRLEAAALTAPVKGAPPSFDRLFGRLPDRGAFRDGSQAAVFQVK